MKYLFPLIVGVLLIGVAACGDDSNDSEGENNFYKTEVPEERVLLQGVKELNDSLARAEADTDPLKKHIPNMVRLALIEKHLLLYRSFPKSKNAPYSLHEVQIQYGMINAHNLAVKYGDTLLQEYPDYPNRMIVIEDQIINYDSYLKPWDKEKVKYYYDLLVKENTDLPEDKMKDIEFRLANMDKTLEEIMMEQMNAIQ